MKLIQKILSKRMQANRRIQPGSQMWQFLEQTDLRRYQVEQELYSKKKML